MTKPGLVWLALVVALASSSLSVERTRCDSTAELERVKAMFSGRPVVIGKQRILPDSTYTPNGRIECAGDIEYSEELKTPSPINTIQIETGQIAGYEYRLSYFDGSGTITNPASGGPPWTISCRVDEMTDAVRCYVSRRPGAWIMQVYPKAALSFSAGGDQRHPGSEIGFRVDRFTAHQTLEPAIKGVEAQKLLAEMQRGQEMLVRWVKWPTNEEVDARVSLGDGLDHAIELSRWAGERIKP